MALKLECVDIDAMVVDTIHGRLKPYCGQQTKTKFVDELLKLALFSSSSRSVHVPDLDPKLNVGICTLGLCCAMLRPMLLSYSGLSSQPSTWQAC